MPKFLLLTATAFLFSISRIIAQDCTVPFVPSSFKARLAWQSDKDGPSPLAIPVVANLNPQQDNMPEIIVAEAPSPFSIGNSNRIQIYRGDGSNFDKPLILTVPGYFDNYPVPGPTIGDVNGDGIPELIMSCYDSKIRVFNNYTENPVAPMNLWITSNGLLDFEDQKPSLADFDGDGTPEIYAGSDIFQFNFPASAAPSLTKVINGGVNKGRSYYNNYGEGSCNPTAVDLLSVADCNGDPDCGGLELVAGPIIYSIDLDLSDGDGYQIKVQRDLNQLVPPPGGYADGYTAVADIDLDGTLDIVVTSKRGNNQAGVYVWNKKGLLRFFSFPVSTDLSGSLACIANLYDDTKAGFAKDLPEILVCRTMNLTCFNLNAVIANPATGAWWNLPTTDYSGWTGSTVYDFNGDGISEIVYRDERNFRILYGGPAPFPSGVDAERNWHKIPCWSITSDEYAVVADLDNDGETEIAVTGGLNGGVGSSRRGRLSVFESDAGPWVPCRNVWNQYNYFVVNVNDDLSIPDQQQTHYLELPLPGSGKRPLNRYLSQRPVFNENYEVVIPLPDASGQVSNVVCKGDTQTIQLSICNTGDKVLKAGTPIAFYQSDPTTTNAVLLGAAQLIPAAVKKDSCAVFNFTLPKMAGTLYGVVNDNGSKPRPFQLGTDFPVTNELECNFLNNLFQFDLQALPPAPNLGPDLGTCSDTLVLLHAGTGYNSYRWHDGSTDSTFQAQKPGLYWVEVTDFCAQKRIDSIRVEVFEHPVIQLDTLNGDCFGTIASVMATANSPYLPISYRWSTSATSPDLTNIPDGTYTVTVTDAKGCTSTNSTWIEAGGNLQVAATTTAIPCFGQTGSVHLNFAVGKPPYLFKWSDGNTGQDLQNAAADNYSVTVTDADGCSQVLQSSLIQPEVLLSTGIASLPACAGIANGEVSFSGASQGTPPYALRWSTNATTPNLSNLPAGSYQLTVTDANGCELVETVQISEFATPATQATVADISCFGASNGSVSVALTGGSPGFQYAWSNLSAASQIDNLEPGNYALTLTYADRKCIQTFDFQVKEPLAVLLAATPAPVFCNGETNGSIDLMVQNGIAPLSFFWSNNSISEDLNDLPAGLYSVTVTDATACTEVMTVDVTEPTALLSGGITTGTACPGMTNGAATFLGATQGTPPYSLQWSTSATIPHLTGLASGPYQLTITDANGCEGVETVQVPEFLTPLSDADVADISCFGKNDGSISVHLSGGSPGFGYLWSNQSAAPEIEHLSPGNYALTLTYADGNCTQTFNFQIQEPLPLIVSAASSPAICNGGLGGEIDLTVQNGIAPLAFLWSNVAVTEDLKNLQTGIYQVTVTDATGCTKTYSQAVAEQPGISLNAVAQQPKCAGGADGNIQLTPGGGIAPFQFKWSNGAGNASISGLVAGSYTVTVTDSAACTEVFTTKVDEPSALQSGGITTLAACPGLANGAATFLGASQGTPPYTLRWPTNAASPGLTGLMAGAYALTITDANGCERVETAQVPEFLSPTTNAIVSDVSCFGKNNGSISVAIVSGSPGFGYQWSNQSATPKIENLFPGIYALTLTYADGKCLQVSQFQINEPPALALLDTLLTAARCFGEASGRIDLSAAGGTPPYLFNWASGQKTEDITQLAAGAYTLTLTDANACPFLSQFTVSQPELLALSPTVHADTCQSFGGAIFTTAAGGVPPYQFAWSNAASSPNLSHLAAGNYTLTMTDAHGCKHLQNIQVPVFGENPALIPFTSLITCAHPTAVIGVSANQSTLNYHWSGPGGSFANQAMQTVSNSGAYAVTTTNSFGCQAIAQIQVLQDKAQPVAEAGPSSIHIPCNETKALLSAAGSSQGAPFQNRWTWLPNGTILSDTLAVILPITEPGLYVHTVLNTINGCTARDSILVDWDERIQAAVSVHPIRCFGDDDGVIRLVDISGGNPPFHYSIDNVHFTNQSTFSGLSPGKYPVRIQDDFGCRWETSVVLTQPDSLSVKLTASDTSIALGRQVVLTALPLPMGTVWDDIVWEPGDLVQGSKALIQRVKPTTHTEFVVRLSDQNGCTAEDRVLVKVHNYNIYVPNVIYPESTQNGHFTIFAGEGVVEIRLMRIFDRWGELVFERQGFSPNDPSSGWDGSFHGQPLNPGVFGWYAEVVLQDGNLLFLKGDVTVVK